MAGDSWEMGDGKWKMEGVCGRVGLEIEDVYGRVGWKVLTPEEAYAGLGDWKMED